ncbi:MAG: flagellar biosynthesis, partial [Acetomicrobium flavidum]|nr:flagellar biosynthesis [Acetomicrobium flavidum]
VAVLLGVGLGEEIPEEAYLAVARILVFLHNVDMGRRGGANGGNVP